MRIGEIGIIVLCTAALAVIAVTQLALTDAGPSAPPRPPPPAATAEVVERVDLPIVQTEGPVTYYVDNCSRCHGAPDTAYPELKSHRRDEALRQMIRNMADGVAMAPIEEHYVQQQFELHNAMFDRKPYLWIDRTQEHVIAGEVIPGTTVRIGKLQARMDGHWFVLPRTEGLVVATLAGESISAKAEPQAKQASE